MEKRTPGVRPTLFIAQRVDGIEVGGAGRGNQGAQHADDEQREHLGSDVIDGIYVLGTRETVTINPETMGNDRSLVSTQEYWYSDELQTNLAVTRIEPGQGKQVIRITGLTRSEPDPHLWDVPIGFTVRDMRSSARQRR